MAGVYTSQPMIAPNPGPGILGSQPLPGETWSQFLQRTGAYKNAADPAALQEAEDAFKVNSLKNQETQTSQTALDKQNTSRAENLKNLASLLASSNDKQFNLDIPGIANTAQNQGMLETSGFGQALANRRSQLTADSDLLLGKTAIANADTAANGIGDIANNANNLDTAGTQRTFSTEDQANSAELAKTLAQYGVTPPAKAPSTLDKVLPYAGPLLSGGAAVATASQGTHLCTHMKKLGIMTHKEVREIHKLIFPVLENHQDDQKTYDIAAPLFIEQNPRYDWSGLKTRLYDNVITASSSEEAFQKYKSVCLELFYLAKVS